jgi:hypothetical protein
MPHSVLPVKTSALLCLSFLCVCVLFCASAIAEPLPLTPAQITDLIKTRGAASAVKQLDQRGQLDDAMDKIGAGKAEWIALAPELAQGTDAGASEELERFPITRDSPSC